MDRRPADDIGLRQNTHSRLPTSRRGVATRSSDARAKVRPVRSFASFCAWAIGVAKYEVLYFRRERATDKHLFGDDIVEQIASRYEILAEEVDPIREALKHCVDELKGRSGKIINLRYASGMRATAIAKEMTLSPGAVRMLLCRVREKSRRCIEKRMRRHENVSAC